MKQFITTSIILAAVSLFAQPTDGIGSIEISVVDKYDAKVAKPFKLSSQPQVRDTSVSKLPVSVHVKARFLSPETRVQPIPPIKIKRTRLKRLPSNDFYLHIGNYATVQTGFAFGSSRNPSLTWGLSGDHFSTQGGLQGAGDMATQYSQTVWSENDLKGQVTYVFGRSRLRMEGFGQWNRYAFYGMPYDSTSSETTAPGRWVQAYGGRLVYEAPRFTRYQMFRGFEAKGHHWIDQAGRQVEDAASTMIDWKLPVEDLELELPLSASWSRLSGSMRDTMTEYWAVKFSPSISDSLNQVHFRVGMNVIFTDASSGTKPYLPPIVHIEFPLVRNVLNVFGGVDGDVDHSGMRGLVQSVPFLGENQDYQVGQSSMVYAGLSGRITSAMGYRFTVQNVSHRNYAMVTRWDPKLDSGRLSVDYVPANWLQASGEVTLETGLGWEIRGHGLVRLSQSSGDGDPLLYAPKSEFGAEALINFQEKIRVDAGFKIVGERDAATVDGAMTLPGFVDLNARVVYTYNKQLNAVAQFRNVLNQKVAWYPYYPIQGFQANLGLIYKF